MGLPEDTADDGIIDQFSGEAEELVGRKVDVATVDGLHPLIRRSTGVFMTRSSLERTGLRKTFVAHLTRRAKPVRFIAFWLCGPRALASPRISGTAQFFTHNPTDDGFDLCRPFRRDVP